MADPWDVFDVDNGWGAAFCQELGWMAFNGVIILLAHDWADPDREVIDDAGIGCGGRV